MSETWQERSKRVRKRFQKFVDHFFRNPGTERPTASIPADRKRDDDLVVSDYIRESGERIQALETALRAVKERMDTGSFEKPDEPVGMSAGVCIFFSEALTLVLDHGVPIDDALSWPEVGSRALIERFRGAPTATEGES